MKQSVKHLCCPQIRSFYILISALSEQQNMSTFQREPPGSFSSDPVPAGQQLDLQQDSPLRQKASFFSVF